MAAGLQQCKYTAQPIAKSLSSNLAVCWRLQGIETVRRDNCELVRNMVATSLDKILIERDEAGAIEYVKGIIRDLLMNKVDMSLLVVTKV